MKRVSNKKALLKSFRAWHKRHPRCTSVFMKESLTKEIFEDASLAEGFRVLTIDGISVLPIKDSELPCRFLPVFSNWTHVVGSYLKAQQIVATHQLFTRHIESIRIDPMKEGQ